MFLSRAYFIRSLFEDADTSKTYYLHITSNCWLEVNNTLESKWKEPAMAKVGVPSRHFPGATEVTDEIPQLG